MSGYDDAMKKITESPFFTFSRLPLDFFEKKKLFKLIFSLVCIVMAVGTLVYPFVILGRTINSGYFNFGFTYVLVFIFVWLAVVAACWLGFHLWWDRQKKAAEIGSSEFIMLPFFSEILTTFGEWLGILFGVIGAVGGFFALLFLGRFSGGTLSAILFKASAGGSVGGMLEELPVIGNLLEARSAVTAGLFNRAVILGPVFGVLIILITRFLAERLRVLAAIANNTKETSCELKKKNG